VFGWGCDGGAGGGAGGGGARDEQASSSCNRLFTVDDQNALSLATDETLHRLPLAPNPPQLPLKPHQLTQPLVFPILSPQSRPPSTLSLSVALNVFNVLTSPSSSLLSSHSCRSSASSSFSRASKSRRAHRTGRVRAGRSCPAPWRGDGGAIGRR
jgi:hypothetical protein